MEDMKQDEYKNCINRSLVPLPLALAPPILHCMIGVVGKCVKRLLYAAEELDIEAEERGAVDVGGGGGVPCAAACRRRRQA